VKETERGSLGERVAVLGDISYSSYLLHFPLQLLATSVAVLAGLDRAMFLRVPVLAGFFVVLAVLSYASYALFERPAQSLLRARLLAAPQ
jgi:peptidoglycan/LPS O-acetylase OafA/YrhL